MIIQTGMRTDIPAFYSKWFLNRIKEGYVCVRNPYNPKHVMKYSLSPEVVDLIAFCTKNPLPMLPFLDELKPYGQYWFVTITPYGRDIEPNVPDKKTVMEGFKELSDVVGIDSIGWRYDPIFIVIGKAFVKIASKYGMVLKPCAEGEELAKYGADCLGCMTVHTFETALHSRLEVPKRKKNQRNGECACLLGTDIGAYDTCGHLCKYCYANVNPVLVKENMRMHNPDSPFLIDGYMTGDIVREAIQKSWIDRQIRLEF